MATRTKYSGKATTAFNDAIATAHTDPTIPENVAIAIANAINDLYNGLGGHSTNAGKTVTASYDASSTYAQVFVGIG